MELADAQKDAARAGRKAMFVGVLALLLAGACGWILARFGRHGPQMQDIVVAAQDLTALTRLKAKYFKVVAWPLESLPQGTFKQPDEILKAYEVNLVDIVAGEPVLAAHVSTLARGLGVSQLVEPSMRAYVIEVHEALAKSHMIHPGAMVDVIATVDSSRGSNTVTKVILQNVQVLAVGDSISLDQADNKTNDKDNQQDTTRTERHRVVTLLVGLGDVEYLAFAASQGHLDLALRNNTDTEIIPTTGVDTAKVFGKHLAEMPGPLPNDAPSPPPLAPHAVSNTNSGHTRGGTGHGRQTPAAADEPTIYKVRH